MYKHKLDFGRILTYLGNGHLSKARPQTGNIMENFFCKSPIFYQQKQPSIASLNGPILSYIQSTCLKVRLMWSQRRRSFPTLYPAEQFQRDICRVQYFHTTYLPRLIFLDVQDFHCKAIVDGAFSPWTCLCSESLFEHWKPIS